MPCGLFDRKVKLLVGIHECLERLFQLIHRVPLSVSDNVGQRKPTAILFHPCRYACKLFSSVLRACSMSSSAALIVAALLVSMDG
jgi:hypothetical protein